MANSISNRQLFFILLLTVTSYTTINLPKIVAQFAGRSGWLLILAMALAFGLAAIVIAKLNNRFPGKTLFEYGAEIVGRPASCVLVVLYILDFAMIDTYQKIQLVNFLSSNFLPKTPQFIILAVSVALFGYISYKGITNVARLFEIYGFAFLLTTVAICLTMLPQGMIYNILPLVNPNEIKAFPGAVWHLIFPFGGIEVLMVIPFTKANRRAALVSFCTLAFIGVFYVLVVMSSISLLGINNTILYSDSFIEAIKIVNVPVIERTDIFYLTIGLVGFFASMIAIYLGVLEYACRLFPRMTRLAMTLITGAVLYAICMVTMGIKNVVQVMESIIPYPIVFFGAVIPAALLILAKVKRKGGSPEGGGA